MSIDGVVDKTAKKRGVHDKQYGCIEWSGNRSCATSEDVNEQYVKRDMRVRYGQLTNALNHACGSSSGSSAGQAASKLFTVRASRTATRSSRASRLLLWSVSIKSKAAFRRLLWSESNARFFFFGASPPSLDPDALAAVSLRNMVKNDENSWQNRERDGEGRRGTEGGGEGRRGVFVRRESGQPPTNMSVYMMNH